METAPEPESKKIKLETLSDIIDEYVEKLKEPRKCLKAVLGDDIDKPIPLVNITVGHFKSPKQIESAIALLNEKCPLIGLSHLKRVRAREVLLCPTEDLEGSSIQSYLVKHVPELQKAFDYFKDIDVPMEAPKVKSQVAGADMWSLNFHPNTYLESLLSDNFFNLDYMRFHNRMMTMALEVVRWYMKGDFGPEVLHKVNATIVVDTDAASVVAVAFCNKDHPIQHSTMVAIDNVAKTQNGGAWGASTKDAFNCTLAGFDADLLTHLRQECRYVAFGARVFKSKRDSSNSEGDVDTSESPYLCTGYYVYTLREPCVMCAMALVHARAKRVFFCFENPECGALSSKVKLQAVPSLNHHFEVFKYDFSKNVEPLPETPKKTRRRKKWTGDWTD
ncbi:cytidine and deoxycytidylate deaminase zinc-binding region domain-containing protein [Phthorimaea operculella]|nr:cytidine and deoxycytidylate deaminase zinc-binding region domain-containing protein [Phthorimaea operculella]